METEKKDKYERERRRGYKTALSHLMLILWYDKFGWYLRFTSGSDDFLQLFGIRETDTKETR